MLHWLQRLWPRGKPAGGPTGARGAAGEELAAEFLRSRLGYRIVVRNWRNPRERREEIDLVCQDHEVLVFVEVKTRSASALVSGFYAVDRRKKRALRRAIHAYLTQLRVRPRTFRFDVAEVVLSATAGPVVRHFQNVPLFAKGYNVLRW
jgi:putative endonuclease